MIGVVGLLIGSAAMASQSPATQDRTNLALGKKVAFSPIPNSPLTAKGETDPTDLTDGKLSERPDHQLWFESSAVGWEYGGRVNLAVDLGQECDIDEIAIRLLGGGVASTGGAMCFPGWVEALVSSDGEHYTKVSEFSRWNKDEFDKFGIVQKQGECNVDTLRFKDMKAHGRYVGFRIYGSSVLASDELYVYGTPSAEQHPAVSKAKDGFTISHPQVYFHKPTLELATNVTLPVPVGLAVPQSEGAAVTLRLILPPGVKIAGGAVGGVNATAHNGNEYLFTAKEGKTDKVFGRLYLIADGWKNGQQGALRYSFDDGNWNSGPLTIPIRAIQVPIAPRLRKIMATMGWWPSTSVGWTDQLRSLKTLGINTYNVFGQWLPKDHNDPRWSMLEEARKQGFFISNIDSPLHELVNSHPDQKEIYDQFEDGTVGKHLCISYRGQYYQEEIQRYAKIMAAVRPDFSSQDIELWGWAGPTDSVKCTRCLADYTASKAGSWAKWQQGKGTQIIHDLITAARQAVKEAGGNPDFNTGGYDFRPDQVYQQLFDFNSLYPKLQSVSQVSVYSSLQAADLEYLGNETRTDRSKLPRSDVMPWNTPGDAGTFPGETFTWALLEHYCNGASGIWFWSSRMWDSEDLIAYNKVIRAIAPVEEVIVDGQLVGKDAAVDGPGRVSGMKLDGRMVLLIADYYGKTDGSVRLTLNLSKPSTLRDLFTGQSVGGPLSVGEQKIVIQLEEARARLLELVPTSPNP
jgi:hypothetical protein